LRMGCPKNNTAPIRGKIGKWLKRSWPGFQEPEKKGRKDVCRRVRRENAGKKKKKVQAGQVTYKTGCRKKTKEKGQLLHSSNAQKVSKRRRLVGVPRSGNLKEREVKKTPSRNLGEKKQEAGTSQFFLRFSNLSWKKKTRMGSKKKKILFWGPKTGKNQSGEDVSKYQGKNLVSKKRVEHFCHPGSTKKKKAVLDLRARGIHKNKPRALKKTPGKKVNKGGPEETRDHHKQ